MTEIQASTPMLSNPSQQQRWPVGAAVVLGVVVVVLRTRLARSLSFCGTPDACFYLGLGQNLAAGRGFQARFLYDFQQAHPSLPNTGLEYWRPGVSLALLLLKPFGGVTLHGSIFLTSLICLLFAAAAWHIAARSSRDRSVALGSFALCLLSSPAWVGSATPDSSLYYGAAVAWFLALFTVDRQGLVQDALALLSICFAYLVRNDAVILGVPLVMVLWARHHAASHLPRASSQAVPPSGISVKYAALMLAGFVAALVPMHLLYKTVLGTAFPSGTAQALYLNDLSDFVRYREPASLHSLLAHGVRHLVLVRLSTLVTVVYRIAALMVGYPALVFLPALLLRSHPPAAGTPADLRMQRLPELLGPGSFAIVMLLLYSFVLPAIGSFSALRTAVGLMPMASVLVVIAIMRTARTPRLAAWLTGAVVAANALGGLTEARRDLVAANTIGDADRAEAAQLTTLGADPATAVVLTGDPVQFSVTTGYATVALPSNGLDAITAAARDFQATHVILDSNTLPASSVELQRQLQPVRSAILPREHSLILELPQTTKRR